MLMRRVSRLRIAGGSHETHRDARRVSLTSGAPHFADTQVVEAPRRIQARRGEFMSTVPVKRACTLHMDVLRGQNDHAPLPNLLLVP